MAASSLLELLIGRVERLLVRHQELQKTNALLQTQIQQLTQERDVMKSRLNTARQRIDALLERLPEQEPPTTTAAERNE
jgi:uncharacterized protein (TIGR02449 family)